MVDASDDVYFLILSAAESNFYHLVVPSSFSVNDPDFPAMAAAGRKAQLASAQETFKIAMQGKGIESIPVAGNEMYVFDYDARRGVTVDFLPAKPA